MCKTKCKNFYLVHFSIQDARTCLAGGHDMACPRWQNAPLSSLLLAASSVADMVDPVRIVMQALALEKMEMQHQVEQAEQSAKKQICQAALAKKEAEAKMHVALAAQETSHGHDLNLLEGGWLQRIKVSPCSTDHNSMRQHTTPNASACCCTGSGTA